MPDLIATTQRLDGLAESFATRDPQAADRFRNLADDLRHGGSRAREWAFSPLDTIFDSQKLVAGLSPARSRRVELFEAARNILVLLPLAITWIGIFVAVDAYARLVAADPAQASQSFIYLWQTGFNDTIWFTLGRVALIDGLILFLVFLLTLAMYAVGHQRDDSAESETLRREIDSTMYEVDRHLANHRAPEAARVANVVADVATDNLKAMREMSVATLAQMSKMNEANLAQLTTMTTQLVDNIGREYNRFEALARQRAEEIAGLTQFTAQLDTAGASMKQAAVAVAESEQAIRSAVADLQAPLVALTGATTLLARNVADVGPVAASATDKLTDLAREQASTVDGLKDLNEGQKAVADSMLSGVTALTESAVAAGTATSQLATASSHLSEEQDRLIDALERERNAQATLANHVSRANYEFGLVLDQFSEAVISIKATATDMMYAGQKFHTMEDVVRNLQAGLGDLVRQQATSAANIEAATNRIEVAAGSFENTVKNLQLASDSLANSASLLAQALAAQPTVARYA